MRWAFWRRKEKKVMYEGVYEYQETYKSPPTRNTDTAVTSMDYTTPLLMAAMLNDRSGGYGHHIHEEARNNEAAFTAGGGEFGGAGSSYDYGSSESSDSGSGSDGSGGSASDVSCGGSD